MIHQNPVVEEQVGRWRALTLLALTLVLATSTWFSASAVIPQLTAAWDLSSSTAAWLTIAVQLGFVVVAGNLLLLISDGPAGGILSDRWGRAETTMLTLAMSAVCFVFIGFLFGASLWLILLIGLIWGITVVADSAQFSTLVAELAE